MLGQNEQLQVYQDRFRYLYLTLAVVTITLTLRLWYLQVLQGHQFKRISEENRLKKVNVPATRGMVFDRNRKLLVDNQPTFNLVIIPQYFRAVSKKTPTKIDQKVSKTCSHVSQTS